MVEKLSTPNWSNNETTEQFICSATWTKLIVYLGQMLYHIHYTSFDVSMYNFQQRSFHDLKAETRLLMLRGIFGSKIHFCVNFENE